MNRAGPTPAADTLAGDMARHRRELPLLLLAVPGALLVWTALLGLAISLMRGAGA